MPAAIVAYFLRLVDESQPRGARHSFAAALGFLGDGVAVRTGLCIRVDSALDRRLAPAVETALYRIMQEGLTNIIKHAAAAHVDLQLWQDARMLYGRLQDDGVGFAVDEVVHQQGPRGLGLLGMQERLEALGGAIQITSAPGQGTALQITLPVHLGEASSEADGAWADPNLPASAGLSAVG
jgi:signal transduction histidine kinase